MMKMAKQCEIFVSLFNKAKRGNMKTQGKKLEIDIEELKQKNELVSNIESYSILEKIHEWKKEEGLLKSNHKLYPCKIPRPMKLMNDLEEEIENSLKKGGPGSINEDMSEILLKYKF